MSETSRVELFVFGFSVRLISTVASLETTVSEELSSKPSLEARTVHEPQGTLTKSATPVVGDSCVATSWVSVPTRTFASKTGLSCESFIRTRISPGMQVCAAADAVSSNAHRKKGNV